MLFSKNFKIIDISPEVSEKMAVYPGDVAFSRKISLDANLGDNLTLSSVLSTLHIGAHADAPNHYHRDGVGISNRSLSYYLGPCQVIEVNVKLGERISVADLNEKKVNKKNIVAPRVLFKTNSFLDFNKWCSDYNSLSPELIHYLKQHNVCLVGIDTPSIDPDDSKNLESHNAIYKNDMAILEGLSLKHVAEGEYFLVALPLKLRDADASPVRAVLLGELT